MEKCFQIGDFSFRIVFPEELLHRIPENFLKFEKDCIPSYTYTIQISESFPQPVGIQTAVRQDLAVYTLNGLETRYLSIRGTSCFYGYYHELDAYSADIQMAPAILGELRWDTVFTSLFALERHLLDFDSVVLHCAYVRDHGRAVLFSAPSETGKTTQADLWHRFRGSETVNGDRALLCQKEDGWYACGWPVCGSSEVCHNEETPIHAIVMLSQAPENSCCRLSASRAFALIYNQLTVNGWNREQANHCMDILSSLVQTVPVYHLGCTISEEAVTCLAEQLSI